MGDTIISGGISIGCVYPKINNSQKLLSSHRFIVQEAFRVLQWHENRVFKFLPHENDVQKLEIMFFDPVSRLYSWIDCHFFVIFTLLAIFAG